MTNVDDFISDINEALKEDKKAALTSIRKVELEKESKAEALARELSALESRYAKLKKVVADINKKSSSLMKNLRSLRGQRRSKRLKLVGLKRDVSQLKGIEKEMPNLKKKVKDLVSREGKKRKILDIKRKKNARLKAALSRLQKSIIKHTASLKKIEAAHLAIGKNIQKKLLNLKKSIPLSTKKISELSQQEKDLVAKRQNVVDLKSGVRAAQERKKKQILKVKEKIRKLKEQEKKLEKLSL
jgi:chromosome segregation ATPase